MVKRRVCITNSGEHIGIESIYSINSEGVRINIPGKVEELRRKSQKGELFCDCGCGSNLILVASDRHMVEQHYRIKHGTGNRACTAVIESNHSFYSKVALKLWLEDKLNNPELASRVPINRFDGSDRRYELTYYSSVHNRAFCYWNDRTSILSDKITEIEQCLPGQVFYIVDSRNAGTDGQYPEFLMKIQEIQGYIAFLSIDEGAPDSIYQTARLEIKLQKQNRNKVWKEISVTAACLKDFMFSDNGKLVYEGRAVLDRAMIAANQFLKNEERLEQAEREKAEKARAAFEEKESALRKKQAEYKHKRDKAVENWDPDFEEEFRKKMIAIAQKEQIANALTIELEPIDYSSLEMDWSTFDFHAAIKPVRDPRSKSRMLQCRLCGKIDKIRMFADAGYPSPGMGVCTECSRNGNLQKDINERQPNMSKDATNLQTRRKCPKCGAELRKKRGSFGYFFSCSNYPICKYSAKVISG